VLLDENFEELERLGHVVAEERLGNVHRLARLNVGGEVNTGVEMTERANERLVATATFVKLNASRDVVRGRRSKTVNADNVVSGLQ
jgi:hypothetical protein